MEYILYILIEWNGIEFYFIVTNLVHNDLDKQFID